ncbi:hypothetical protein OEZ85_012265 [Tetradesmus obliquus]|uniref:Uncharacterized protein n=1 Tax=Tetradesmus obliquus TaxID=3088 RepID=A0ABY8TSY1_TETOB|nr:hypothetical protein OEZ85_012265 [Tetradesmus obliquus]
MRSTKGQAAVLLLLVATSLVTDVAAKCDRTGLDKETRGGTWTVYMLKEYDWVDYIIIAGCAASSFVPGVGWFVSSFCAAGLVGTITNALNTYFVKQAVAPPTQTQLKDGLAAGGAELTSPDGLYNVRLGVAGFTCKTCNCQSCVKNNVPRFADCKRCGEYCTPEPNRVGIYVATRKNPNAPGGSSTGSRCITINNACSTDYYASVGLANNWSDGSATYLRWWSQGWWKVPANTGTSPVRLCFTGISQFYLHFLDNAVTFNKETSSWCIHSWKKYSIIEMDNKDTIYFNYYDNIAGVGGSTCQEMGSEYKEVIFYRFVHSSSTATNYNINIACSKRAASRATDAANAAVHAIASVRATSGVAALPNPSTVSAGADPEVTTAAIVKEEGSDSNMAAETIAVPAAAADGTKPAPVVGSADLAGTAAKPASP